MAIGIIPAALLAADKWDDFVIFLQTLPIDAQSKKYLIIEWCQLTGVALTGDLVNDVLGYTHYRMAG